jgi:hypothetical protein
MLFGVTILLSIVIILLTGLNILLDRVNILLFYLIIILNECTSYLLKSYIK